MYDILVYAHSWLRWAVVIFGVMALLRSWQGWQQGRIVEAADKRINLIFIASLHLQLLLGILLYFVYSPFGYQAVSSMGMSAVMKNAAFRFWSMEHWFIMLSGVVVAQIGSIKAKKQTDATAQHRVAFKWFAAAMLLLLVGVLMVVTSGHREWVKF